MKRELRFMFAVTVMLCVCAVALPATLMAAGVSETKPDVVEWKIGLATPPGHPHTLGAEYLANLLEERSEGRLSVRVHHSGELGSNPELMDEVKQGVVTMTVNTPGHMAEYDTISGIGLFELPYLLNSLEHRAKVVHGEIGQYVADVYLKNTGMRILGYFGGAQRNFITKKPIRSISDFEGLTMRTWSWDVILHWHESLGALPAVLPFTEVYTALQTGVADGAENEFTTFIVSKWAEPCSYIAMTQHNITVRPLVINENTLSQLPEDLQEIVIQAGKDASAYAEQLEISLDEKNIDVLREDYNIEFTYPDKTPFIERTIPIIRSYAAKQGLSDLADRIIELGN